MVFLDVITRLTTKKKLIACSVSEHVKYIQDGHVAKKLQTIRMFLNQNSLLGLYQNAIVCLNDAAYLQRKLLPMTSNSVEVNTVQFTHSLPTVRG